MKRYIVNPDVAISELDGVKTLFNPVTSLYFGLDEVGTLLWNELSKEVKSLEDLVLEVIKEFDVGKKVVEKDVKELLDAMLEAQLILRDEN